MKYMNWAKELHLFKECNFNWKKVYRTRYENSKGMEGIYSTDLMEYLIMNNVSQSEAHGIVGKLIRHSIDKKKLISDMLTSELQKFHPLFNRNLIKKFFNPIHSVNFATSYGCGNLKDVRRQIRRWERKLNRK